MRVMLVDDEKLALDNLKSLIPWEEYGFTIVVTATNGKIAMDMYEKFRPEIVIVDINMPVINGLELSRRILSFNDHVKIIILSAYADFNYAKQAIDIGLCKYMVKHEINEVSLLEEMIKIKNEWEYEEKNIAKLKDEMLRNIIKGYKNLDNSQYSSLQKYGKDLLLFLVQKNDPFLLFYNNAEVNQNTCPNIKKPDASSVENIILVSCVEINNGLWAVIYAIQKSYSEQRKWEQIRNLAIKIYETYANIIDYNVKVAINTTSDGFPALQRMFNDTVYVLQYRVFLQNEKLLRVQELVHFCSNEGMSVLPDNEFIMLMNNLENGKLESVSEQINNIFNYLKNPPWRLNSLKEICYKLLDIFDQYCQKSRIITSKTLIQQARLGQNYWDSLDDIANWFNNQISSIYKFINECRTRKYSSKIIAALNYVHRNYGEDLSLGRLALELDISPIYLSQLFKKELDSTFLEYLTHYRIEEAKKLISNSNLTMYQIAEMTGFKTSQYFSFVFKKVIGMSPIDYRENKGYPS